jgi:hypothetical protein
MNVKVFRNNALPIIIYYLVFISCVLGLLKEYRAFFASFSLLSVSVLPVIILATAIFTRYVIIFVSQKYFVYDNSVFIQSMLRKNIEIEFQNIAQIKLERSIFRSSSVSVYYYIILNTTNGDKYRFGPMINQEIFIELLKGNYIVDITRETGIAVVDEEVSEQVEDRSQESDDIFKEDKASKGSNIYLLFFLGILCCFFLIFLFAMISKQAVMTITSNEILVVVLIFGLVSGTAFYLYCFFVFFYTCYTVDDKCLEITNKVLRVGKSIYFEDIYSAKMTERMNWFKLANYTFFVDCILLELKNGTTIQLIPIERTHVLLDRIQKKIM